MPEIIQKLVNLLNYASSWFDQYILSGLANFLKGLGNLIIKVLEVLIDIIRWVISHL